MVLVTLHWHVRRSAKYQKFAQTGFGRAATPATDEKLPELGNCRATLIVLSDTMVAAPQRLAARQQTAAC